MGNEVTDIATNIYAVQLHAAKPGPGHGKPGVTLPDIASMQDCYRDGKGKSCHIRGQAFFFGEAENQGTVMTADEIAFGERSRKIYADIIKNGSSKDLKTFTESNGQWNILDIDTPNTTDYPSRLVCTLFDNINSYGKI